MHILLLAWLFQENTKNKTWKQLPKYYPNILYVALFNWLYYFLVHNKLLWELQSSIMNRKTLKIIHICIINRSKISRNLLNARARTIIPLRFAYENHTHTSKV